MGAKKVELAVVDYVDEFGDRKVQLVVLGENNMHLLDGSNIGFFATTRGRSGPASDWFKNGVNKILGKKK